jgi:hypothetical protein
VQESAAEFLAFLGGGPNQVGPGTYRLVLTVDGVEYSQPLHIQPDPNHPQATINASSGEDGEEIDP